MLNVKRQTSHISRFTSYALQLTLNVSRLTNHAKRLTFNVSRLTPYSYELFRTLFDPKGRTSIAPDGIGGEKQPQHKTSTPKGLNIGISTFHLKNENSDS